LGEYSYLNLFIGETSWEHVARQLSDTNLFVIMKLRGCWK